MKKVSLIMAICLTIISVGVSAQEKKVDTIPGLRETVSFLFKQPLEGHGLDGKVVEMTYVDFPPGSTALPHRHPCPLFVYVLQGEIVSVFEGKKYRYKAGDVFYESPNGLHENAWNESTTTPAKIIAFFIKDDATQLPLVPAHK